MGELKQESTEALVDRWNDPGRVGERSTIHDELRARGIEPPDLAEAPEGRRGKLEGSNAALLALPRGKVQIEFPADGVMTPGRFEFRDHDEFWNHVASTFGVSGDASASFSRRGKYRRVDEDGNPLFTFGDPILDACTNRHGLIVIGDERIDARALAIESGGLRWGTLDRDLSAHSGRVLDAMLAAALQPDPRFVLLDCDAESASFASRNPSNMSFSSQNPPGVMVFQAWRSNYWFYWSIGAEIVTWGKNFKSASITGRYGRLGGGAAKCSVLKQDSDSDTNDCYMDEWEAGTVNSTVPDGVRSACKADWAGGLKAGTISKGACGANF